MFRDWVLVHLSAFSEMLWTVPETKQYCRFNSSGLFCRLVCHPPEGVILFVWFLDCCLTGLKKYTCQALLANDGWDHILQDHLGDLFLGTWVALCRTQKKAVLLSSLLWLSELCSCDIICSALVPSSYLFKRGWKFLYECLKKKKKKERLENAIEIE